MVVDNILCHANAIKLFLAIDVRIDLPSEVVDGVTESLNPQKCRLSDNTYAAPILVNIKYCNGNALKGQKPVEYKKSNVVIGRLPIMPRSCRCILYEKDEVALANLGECPLDPGGYFVVNGNEKETGEDFSVEPAESRRSFRALLDVGLLRTTTGNRVFGALKGALDGGLDIPHSENRFVGFSNDSKSHDADVHHKYIYGGHVAAYMKVISGHLGWVRSIAFVVIAVG